MEFCSLKEVYVIMSKRKPNSHKGDNGEVLGKFYRKLSPLENSKQHPQTMAFWEKNKEAYLEATSNPEDPKIVMDNYANWLEDIKKKYKKKEKVYSFPEQGQERR